MVIIDVLMYTFNNFLPATFWFLIFIIFQIIIIMIIFHRKLKRLNSLIGNEIVKKELDIAINILYLEMTIYFFIINIISYLSL